MVIFQKHGARGDLQRVRRVPQMAGVLAHTTPAGLVGWWWHENGSQPETHLRSQSQCCQPPCIQRCIANESPVNVTKQTQCGCCRCHERNRTMDGHTCSLSPTVSEGDMRGRGSTKHGLSTDASLMVLEVCGRRSCCCVCVCHWCKLRHMCAFRI